MPVIAAVLRSRYGGKVVAASVVAALAAVLLSGCDHHDVPAPLVRDASTSAEDDSTARLEQLLQRCRTRLTCTAEDREPAWDDVDGACQKALALEPISEEALHNREAIARERACCDKLRTGARLISAGHEDEGLEAFAGIRGDCASLREAKELAPKAVDKVVSRLRRDCDDLLAARSDAADATCEKFLSYQCPRMSEEDLAPPIGFHVACGTKHEPTGWVPKDPTYRKYLCAGRTPREPWTCTPAPFQDVGTDPPGGDDKDRAREVLAAAVKDRELVEAYRLFWAGRQGEALAVLLRLETDRSHVAKREELRRVRADMATTDAFYKSAQTALARPSWEDGVSDARHALEAESRVFGGFAGLPKSFYRRDLEETLAKVGYALGRSLMDHGDAKGACAIWRTAFGFTRASVDLVRGASACSLRGRDALNAAAGCDDLAAVSIFAFDGDGLMQKVSAKKAELGCAE